MSFYFLMFSWIPVLFHQVLITSAMDSWVIFLIFVFTSLTYDVHENTFFLQLLSLSIHLSLSLIFNGFFYYWEDAMIYKKLVFFFLFCFLPTVQNFSGNCYRIVKECKPFTMHTGNNSYRKSIITIYNWKQPWHVMHSHIGFTTSIVLYFYCLIMAVSHCLVLQQKMSAQAKG